MLLGRVQSNDIRPDCKGCDGMALQMPESIIEELLPVLKVIFFSRKYRT